METKEVFNSVASKYDIMNDVMSMGIHRYWKELMIDWLSPHEEMKIIDVAGGTGDISRRFLKRVNGKGKAIVCDPNENMVEAGKRIKQYSNDIKWVVAPAEELPFEDNTFDAYLVSFGVRNFSDLKKSLQEAKRVLKPGGILCFNDSIQANDRIGATKESLKGFPDNYHEPYYLGYIQDDLKALFEEAGFKQYSEPQVVNQSKVLSFVKKDDFIKEVKLAN